MIRKIVALLFISFILNKGDSLAQNLGHEARFMKSWDTIAAQVSSSSYYMYGSTFLDLKMVQLFNQGGTINEPLKTETLARIKNNNFVGGEYRSTLTFQDPGIYLIGRFGYYATMEVGGIVGINAARDLVPFTLRGNVPFLGDTAHLAPSEYSLNNYQKFGIGLNKHNRLKIGLSLINFNQYEYGKIESGYIAVNDTFSTMQLSLNGQYERGDTSINNYFSSKGIGIGFDLEATVPLKFMDSLSNSAPHFVIGAKNIGVFLSSKNAMTYDLRTNYQFDGFEINSLQNFESSVFNLESEVDSLKPVAETERLVRLLPFELYFYSPSNPNGKKLQVIYGFRYINRSIANATGYVGMDLRTKNNAVWSSYLNFGGFYRAQWGFSIRKDWGKLQMGLVTNHILGFITKEAYGQSLGLTLNYRING
jgi:hypothetical protein